MISDCTSDIQICRATPADLLSLFAWVEEEWTEDGEGFWRARNTMRNAFEVHNDLWICRVNGDAAGYQIGDHAAAYLAVRKHDRRRGIGTVLVEASVARALRDDLNVLEVQCEPTTSLKFWQSLDFEQFHNPARPGEVHVRRFLQRAWPLPPGEPVVQVGVRFYNEAALWCRPKPAIPILDESVLGARLGNGVIQLNRRILCLDIDRPHRDVVVQIEVDGRELCLGKAKSRESRRIGLKDDPGGGLFYIDQLEDQDG